MVDEPLILTDEDFTEDAPPGYLSQQAKAIYIPWMATLLGGAFVLQFILPMLIFLIAFSSMTFQQFSGGMSQYSKMTAWQDGLWYPVMSGPVGAIHGGCQLQALTYEGEPRAHTPPIELSMQPEWLLAQSERLWAISHSQVAEISPKGTPPLVMFPSRYLQHPSRPFFHDGKLAIIDWDDTTKPSVFVLEQSEWKSQGELTIAAESRIDLTEDAPADALEHEHARRARNPATPPSLMQQKSFERVEVVPIGGDYHVFSTDFLGKIYHQQGIPWKSSTTAKDSPVSENIVEIPRGFEMKVCTVIEGKPAIITTSFFDSKIQILQFHDGAWKQTATQKFSLAGMTDLRAWTTPDGSRTFGVMELMGGMTEKLIELKPDEVRTVKKLSATTGYANPQSSEYIWLQVFAQVPTYILLLIVILGTTWMMKRYRDPNFYKGRLPVAYASILRRCVATLLDSLISMGVVQLVWAWWWYTQDDFTLEKLLEVVEQGPQEILELVYKILPGLWLTLGWIVLWQIIHWVMLSCWGFTVGKYVCGVRVVRKNLEVPGLGFGLVRYFLDWIEKAMFNGLIGFTLVAFLQDRQRLADLVAGTIVVKAASLRQARIQQQRAEPGSLV